MGNSTRKLAQSFDYISLLLAINDLDNPNRLVCNSKKVRTTMNYFKKLYDHSHISTLPKS